MHSLEDTPAHVLLTADAVGGVFTQANDLAQGLRARGVRVTLAILGPSMSRAQRDAAAATGAAQVVETGLPLEWTAPEPQAVEAAGARLSALARDCGADLVHLHNPAYAAVRFDVPVVATLHSCMATWWATMRGGQPAPRDFAWRHDAVARAMHNCDAVLAPTAAFAALAGRLYPGVRFEVVLNGRDPLPGRRPARRSGILASGRWWDEAKNLAILDAAAALVGTPVEAFGPCEGPDLAPVAARSVVLRGNMPNDALRRRLASARIYVSLARYEPFGLGVLEAALGGCALVLSDIPAFRELWDGAACFVHPLDAGDAALTLNELDTSPAACARLAALARERAARFSVGAMTAETLGVYRRAMVERVGDMA